jgi:hypothetical protein
VFRRAQSSDVVPSAYRRRYHSGDKLLRSGARAGCIVPIRFTFDPKLNMLFTIAEGLISFEEIEKHLEEEAAQSLLGHREVFDAYAATTNLTDNQVRAIVSRLVEMARNGAFGPTALVTNNDMLFGMAMMMKILSELRGGPRIGVFRSFDAGLDWLVRS